jgi:hypothetical protein
MQKVLFFSRVAFICNVCFVLTWLLRYYPSLQMDHGVATIVVLGIVVSGILNLVVNVAVIIALLTKKNNRNHFPYWLIIVNFLFLIVQIILFPA